MAAVAAGAQSPAQAPPLHGALPPLPQRPPAAVTAVAAPLGAALPDPALGLAAARGERWRRWDASLAAQRRRQVRRLTVACALVAAAGGGTASPAWAHRWEGAAVAMAMERTPRTSREEAWRAYSPLWTGRRGGGQAAAADCAWRCTTRTAEMSTEAAASVVSQCAKAW
jgi:hypothetical protein